MASDASERYARIPEMCHEGTRPVLKTHSGRTAASFARDQHLMFALGGVAETSENIVAREVRKILQQILFRHAGGEIRQHVIHGHAHSTDAWLTATLARLEG